MEPSYDDDLHQSACNQFRQCIIDVTTSFLTGERDKKWHSALEKIAVGGLSLRRVSLYIFSEAFAGRSDEPAAESAQST